MSDGNTIREETIQAKTRPVSEIKAEVTRRLKTSSDVVKERITDSLYESEVKRRTEAAMNVVSQIEAKERELTKINRPDIEVRTADGKLNESASGYSKARIEEIRKLKEELGKLEGKLVLAFEKGDWSKLLGG